MARRGITIRCSLFWTHGEPTSMCPPMTSITCGTIVHWSLTGTFTALRATMMPIESGGRSATAVTTRRARFTRLARRSVPCTDTERPGRNRAPQQTRPRPHRLPDDEPHQTEEGRRHARVEAQVPYLRAHLADSLRRDGSRGDLRHQLVRLGEEADRRVGGEYLLISGRHRHRQQPGQRDERDPRVAHPPAADDERGGDRQRNRRE